MTNKPPQPVAAQPLTQDFDDDRDPRHDWAALSENRTHALAAAHRLFGASIWTKNLNQPEPPWLIDDLIQERSIHVISAAQGTCKTWLAANIFLAGRYGIPVLGRPVTQPFNSIYIAADSPLWDIRRQFRKLLLGNNLKPERSTASFLAPLGFTLDNVEHLRALALLVQTWNIRSAIFDVMLYVHSGDENADREMANLMMKAKFLRDNLGLAVIFLHHHGKIRGDARGAGTITQACEHHYELRRKDGAIRCFREKIRGEASWSTINFALTTTPNNGKILSVIEPGPAPESVPTISNTILTALSAGPQSRQTLATFATSSKQLDNALARLRRQGLITTDNHGGWSLCPSSSST